MKEMQKGVVLFKRTSFYDKNRWLMIKKNEKF